MDGMTDNKHLQGYANWASLVFARDWANYETVRADFIEKAAAGWATEHHGDPAEIGRILVDYAREHYTGEGEGAIPFLFTELDKDVLWDAIDRTEVGEAIRAEIAGHDTYSYLMDEGN